MERPEYTEELKAFDDLRNRYNNAVQDMNTCYGGHRLTVHSYELIEDSNKAIAEAIKFGQFRQAQVELVNQLAVELGHAIEQGMGHKMDKFMSAMGTWHRQNQNAKVGA